MLQKTSLYRCGHMSRHNDRLLKQYRYHPLLVIQIIQPLLYHYHFSDIIKNAMRLGKLGEQIVIKSKFVDIADSRMKEYFSETNLKRLRTAYGLTQAALSEHSGVSLRSIQMYEQRNKHINKASVDTVYRLAKILGCEMEDLMEK